MDIRQCTATNVIKPKFVRKLCSGDPSGWRKCKVSSIKPNLQVNWTYSAIISVLFNGKSGHMINYPLYDAIHEKNILHIRAIHASPKVPQSPIIIIHNVCTWNANCCLWTRNVMYKDFATIVRRHRYTNTYQTQYIMRIFDSWIKSILPRNLLTNRNECAG